MKGYRKTSGVYIELSDDTPVSSTMVQVALRPSVNYIFSDTWNANPMDAASCWRLKTTTETNAERDTELQSFLDSPGGKAVKAIALVLIDKGVCTLADLRTKYRSL